MIDALLSMSCLGTNKVWSQLGNVVALNLTLLGGVMKAARLERRLMSLLNFPTQVREEINQLMQQAQSQWVTKEAILSPVISRLQMLD